MRKILPLTLSLALMAFACTSNKSGDEQVQNSKDIQIDSFYSADRAFADVRGNAKQCVVITTDMEQSADTLRPSEEALTTTLTQNFSPAGYITEVSQADTFMDQPVGSSCFSFEFDESGALVSSNSDFGGRFLVNRNRDGYVVSFTSIGPNGDVDYTKTYVWDGPQLKSQQLANEHHPTDADGNPIIMPVDKVVYTYDDKGYRVTDIEESGDPQLQMNITETRYGYNDFDEHGNWTSRNVSRVAKVYTVAPSSKRSLTDSVATYQCETRYIVYY